MFFTPLAIMRRLKRQIHLSLSVYKGKDNTFWIESKENQVNEHKFFEYNAKKSKMNNSASIDSISGNVNPENYTFW